MYLLPGASPVLDGIGRFQLQLLAHTILRVCLGIAHSASYPAHFAPTLLVVAFGVIGCICARIFFVDGSIAQLAIVDVGFLGSVVDFATPSEGS